MCQQERREQVGYFPNAENRRGIFRVDVGLSSECANIFVSWWMFSAVSCFLETGLDPETQIFLGSTPSLAHCEGATNTPGGKTLISALKAVAAIKQTGVSTALGSRGKSGLSGQDGSHWDTFVSETVLYNFWPNF